MLRHRIKGMEKIIKVSSKNVKHAWSNCELSIFEHGAFFWSTTLAHCALLKF